MDYQIVTNNPQVIESYDNVLSVEGGYEEVLMEVRDKVYEGYDLITHPHGASLRMMFGPYRSILIGNNKNNINEFNVTIIENSIETYKKHMEVRKPDIKNAEDYAFIDAQLLESSVTEHERFCG